MVSLLSIKTSDIFQQSILRVDNKAINFFLCCLQNFNRCYTFLGNIWSNFCKIYNWKTRPTKPCFAIFCQHSVRWGESPFMPGFPVVSHWVGTSHIPLLLGGWDEREICQCWDCGLPQEKKGKKSWTSLEPLLLLSFCVQNKFYSWIESIILGSF